MSYQFCIHNDNKIHGSYDNKISTTIIAIIEEFFLQNLNVLIFATQVTTVKKLEIVYL